jgi:predicted nucleotidyltransferase
VIDLPDDTRRLLIAWAERTSAIGELWLFGSRAKGTSHSDSDVDLAAVLMPPIKNHDWALGDYVALCDRAWKPELAQIVGGPVDFGAIGPDNMEQEVRSTGILLWKRGAPPSA